MKQKEVEEKRMKNIFMQSPQNEIHLSQHLTKKGLTFKKCKTCHERTSKLFWTVMKLAQTQP